MKAAESDEVRHRMDSQGFYKLDVPQKLNMARVMVDYWAEHGRANDVAIYYLDQKITYGELKDLSDRFAMALHKLGIAKGDRFVIRTPNQPEYMIAFLGGPENRGGAHSHEYHAPGRGDAAYHQQQRRGGGGHDLQVHPRPSRTSAPTVRLSNTSS